MVDADAEDEKEGLTMILLSEFLKNVFSLDGNPPPIWIYDGPDAITLGENGNWDESEGLICLFKSDFIPEISVSEKLLASTVTEIYWTPKGIALGVEYEED